MLLGKRFRPRLTYFASFLYFKVSSQLIEGPSGHHLLDKTYATYRYKMPMINILAVTSNNLNLSVGVCFVEKEDTESFGSALQQLRRVMIENNVELPQVILTDRELALVNNLSHYFPESGHILCTWHVHKNVEHHSKKEFPMPIEKGVNYLKYQEFVDAWKLLIDSPTSQIYEDRLGKFEGSDFPLASVKYC